MSDVGFRVTPTRSMAETSRALAQRNVDLVLVAKESLEDAPAEIADLAGSQKGLVVALLAPPVPQDDTAALLQAGAYGYLSLDLSPEELERSLGLLVMRDIVVSRDLAGDFSNAIGVAADETAEDRLSQREREVLGLVAAGKTNREIAQDLIVTESTVKVHLRNVLDKLNLRNRQQAAAYAAKEGMLDEPEHEDAPADAEQV